MSELKNIFHDKVLNIFPKKLPKKIAVAVSGGADSLALTILLHDFCVENKIKLLAVTVDHKMRESSNSEALALNKFLTKKKISHQILEIDAEKIPQKNIEATLRELRYSLLCGFCKKNKITDLFLGHHLGDVAENFLIRLFRGSGLDGLSTIAKTSKLNEINLVRPLLDFSKDDLKAFLKSKKIKWFEDKSNEDEKFLRNKIRKFLESFPDQNLIQKRIKNSSDEIAKYRDQFDLAMLEEASKSLVFQNNKFLIDLKKFKKIEEKSALKILALIAIELSGKNYKPRLEKLKIFYDWILHDKFHKPRDFYGCVAKKQNDFLSLSKRNSSDNIIKLRTILKNIFQ